MWLTAPANFINFLKHEKVASVPTDMTFGVSRDQGAFEWAGTNLAAIFAQRSNLLNLNHWRMIYDIIKFNQYALDLLRHADESEEDPSTTASSPASAQHPKSQQTIGDYLYEHGYSDAFRDNYLIPMTAAVWSTDPDKCALEFPALTLIRFMWNHHLLTTVAARPDWMTIPSGSRAYIDAILRHIPAAHIHLSTPVLGLEDINGKVIVQFEDSEDLYDHVILACHGDTALDLVGPSGTEEERAILAGFETTENTAVLHSDRALLPRRRAAWAAWNLLFDAAASPAADRVSLTYNMNILQHLPAARHGDVLVTLNPLREPDPASVQGRWTYHHPLYTAEAIRAQKALARIQNTRGISYAGAWTKYGFHEDGFSSGVKVALDHLGAHIPFDFVDSTFSRGRRPVLAWQDYAVRVVLWYLGWIIWWFEPYVGLLVRILQLVGIVPSRKAARSKTE